MEPILLKPHELVPVLGLSRSKIYELLAAGVIPSIRIGNSLRVPVDQLRQWVAKCAAK